MIDFGVWTKKNASVLMCVQLEVGIGGIYGGKRVSLWGSRKRDKEKDGVSTLAIGGASASTRARDGSAFTSSHA